MDAKAKVVAWQRRVFDSDEGWGGWMDSDKYAAELFSDPRYVGKVEMRALIPLTDHEAALAELKMIADNRFLLVTIVEKKLREKEAELTTLLAGLEALAEEMKEREHRNRADYESTRHKYEPDYEALGKADAYEYCEEKICTLTNSAKGST